MKRILILILVLFPAFLFAQEVNYIDAKDHAVLISAETQTEPVAITLKWVPNDKVEGYYIRRKGVNWKAFPNTYIAQLPGNVHEFTDNDVELGEIYEYEIRAASKGHVRAKNNQGENIDLEIDFIGFGYATAGVNIEEPDDIGVVLLIVDETIIEPLQMEIERLENDLTLEGWTVERIESPRAESFDKDKVRQVKDAIHEQYIKYVDDLKTVFLLGRVPVPYSGDLNPDAHPDHKGAWPSDMFYGVIDDAYWRDNSVNNSNAKREANKNIPGDGKFDVSILPSNAEIDLMVGRVDLYNMPLFEKSEIELLRQYLDQNHKYRTNQLTYEKRALIEDDRFLARSMYEGFASGAWRSFGTAINGENVTKGDFLEILKDDSYMFVYGAGPGSYTSCGGVANTQNYVDNQMQGLFSMLFGSYFGDWDNRDNMLRAPLCNDYPALMNAWSGRPQWFMHHISSGYSLGYSTRLTQNNNPGSGYLANVLFIGQWVQDGVLYSSGYRQVHVSLMGDPTLRLDQGIVPEPTNITGTVISNGAEIEWEVPEIDGIYHFNIYRKTEDDPVFRKINNEPLIAPMFTDDSGYDGKVEYMVKTAMLYHTNTTSIFKESRGVLVELLNTDVNEFPEISINTEVSPNPAIEYAEIKCVTSINGMIDAAIYDQTGNLVHRFDKKITASGQHVFTWNLNTINNTIATSGTYLFKAVTNDGIKTAKIIVVR